MTPSEMWLQRKKHKHFIAGNATMHHGSVFDKEGDAFRIEFQSVTDANLAAIDMYQSLQSLEAGRGKKWRPATRFVITVSDLLHQEKDTIGSEN